jgi:hypothetical protein
MGCFDIRPKFRGGQGIVMGRNGLTLGMIMWNVL